MPLAEEHWSSASYDDVVLAFLEAEWGKYPEPIRTQCAGLIVSPSLSSERENRIRAKFLWALREPLLTHVPGDTRWFAVTHLRRQHFPELHAINHPAWTSPNDRNELLNVACRRPERLKSEPSAWAPPILWGHQKSGPFTILEGNHRLTALAGSIDPPEFSLAVYVGLSDGKCLWHRPDADSSTDNIARRHG
ncbi:MAG TPA: hypothetical protein VIZ63_02995 [Povalibacter sp.]